MSNDPKTITEKLNCFFSSISEKLKAQQSGTSTGFDWETFESHVESKIPENVKFEISFMTLHDLLSSIRFLNPNKATGLDAENN